MSNRLRLLGMIVVLSFASLFPCSLHAQWIEGGTVPVCVAPGTQTQPAAAPDGIGGVVIAWLDCRDGCNSIYAQRLDALGLPRWSVNGVRVSGYSADKQNVVIAPDGAGGAIVAWVQSGPDLAGKTSRNVYAQRIDVSGAVAWDTAGVVLCRAAWDQYGLMIVTDGSGGAIAAWNDRRRTYYVPPNMPDVYMDVYAQRVDSTGALLWGSSGRGVAGGVPVCYLKDMIPDGNGGAIVAFQNVLSSPNSGYGNMHVRRLGPGGNMLWDARAGESEGDLAYFVAPRLVTDGASGVIIAWVHSFLAQVSGQRIDASGAVHWGDSGKVLLDGAGSFGIASDARGGAIVNWDTLAQRFDGDGNEMWAHGGVDAGVAGSIVSDGAGGAIIGNGEFHAVQRIDSSGSVVWGPSGAPTSAGENMSLLSDNALGAIQVYGSQDIRALRANPSDHGPVLGDVGALTAGVGDTLRIQLSATDPDPSDALVFYSNAAASIVSPFMLDSLSGLFTWAPRPGDAGDLLVTFAVTDGIFSDVEDVPISVFEGGDRPPVLAPLADITVSAGSAVVVEAHATDPDTDAVSYSMPDPRFIPDGNVFRWETAPPDTGTYSFDVTASDGLLSSTASVNVTVLPARFYYYGHDAMDGEPGSWFDWGTNAALWSSDLDGYFSGSTAGDNWSSCAVSRRGYDASSNPTANFRIAYDQSGSQYMLGFTPTGADGTDFSSSNVTLGLRVHVGFFKPSWDLNTNWGRPIPSGIVDIRITILEDAGNMRVQAQRVASFDSPLSTFNDPDWSIEVSRPIGDLYYVQAAPVNSDGRIYDVWAAPEGPAPVLHVPGEVSAQEGSAAVIEANADYTAEWPLAYWIDDPRYSRAESIFTWQTQVGDAGVYHPVVYVSDGHKTDSASVRVTVTWENPGGWMDGGAPVCLAAGAQDNAQIVPDGFGGVIIAWIDQRNGNADIYAQRLDADGMPLWAPNGVPVCTDPTRQRDLVMVSDGTHGAYVVWLNEARTDVMGQRIDVDGNRLWAASGIGVGHTHFGGWLSDPQVALASDGNLLVACLEAYESSGVLWYNADLSCYSAAGSRQFEATYDHVLEGMRYVRVAADPFGGAILSYSDLMVHHGHAVRVAGDGSTLWTGTYARDGAQYVASDGTGGAIVCVAGLSGSKDIWAQRFTASGQAAWTADGIPICTAAGSQSIIGLESSGADRFTVAWLDTRSGSNEIYAQSVDTSGTMFWQVDGVRINGTHGVQQRQCMASDDFGGAFVAWSDGPLFVQHIVSSGALLWGAGADTLRSGAYGTGRLVLAWTEECGVVAAWNDDRNGEMDVFANSKSTGLCNHPPVLAAIGNKRADVGVELSIQLAATDPDAGDELVYGTNAGSMLPSAFSFDASTGLFSWTPASGDAGDYTVTFSVTDGIYIDTETILITVFEHNTRPPVIEPIADVSVIAEMTVVIEAHAIDPDGDALVYSISDARFTQRDSVFTWQTTPADTGTYHFIVSATDGHLADSTTVTVRVFPQPPYYDFYDPMTGMPGSPFQWAENGIVWHPEEMGYLSGTEPATWNQAVVSGLAVDAASDSQAVFRLKFVRGVTNYVVGFAETPPTLTDFDRARVKCGLYLHSAGTLRPSWSINTIPWSFTLTTGIWDVRITLHRGSQIVGFDLQHVDAYGDPLSAFSAPDWSGELSRPISGTYYVQINPYSSAAKVYDVWLGDPCGGGPVLQPIDDVVVWEEWVGQQEVIVEAHATCRCGCTLQYRISDPRFMQCGDGVFCWLVEEGDAGEYHPVVYATDGTETDSVTVNVTVLRQCRGCVVQGYFSPMAAASDGPFAWHEDGVTWNGAEQGYLSGGAPAGWHSGVVSGASFPTAPQRSVIVRFLRSGVTNTRIGFTFTPPRENDFDSRKIDCGVHVDSTGSVYPTGPETNPDAWITGLHEGVYDLKIDLDPTTSTVTRSLVRVPRYSDPTPDFSTVVWSVAETKAIADSCWVQISPYNAEARIYDVWSGPLVSVNLQSSSATMDGGAVVLSWTLGEGSDDVPFLVSREENGEGVFEELVGIPIERDGLTYTARDTTCAPGASYRYLVEANLPTGRTTLFYQSIKTPAVPLALLQNVPNPFAALTTIGYDLPGEDRVTIDVYDVLGRNVARLVDARKTGGRHTIGWNGNDKNGRRVSSGIYFYRVEWRGQTLSRKMILLR